MCHHHCKEKKKRFVNICHNQMKNSHLRMVWMTVLHLVDVSDITLDNDYHWLRYRK